MAIESELLARILYFNGLSRDDFEPIKKYIVLDKTVEKGETFLYAGDLSDYLYFLVSGVVKVYKTSADGTGQILHIAPERESLSDVSSFDGGPNAASMRAMTPIQLYGVRKRNLETLFREHPRVAMNAAKLLVSRVRCDSTPVEELSCNQVINRLAKMLFRYSAVITETGLRLT